MPERQKIFISYSHDSRAHKKRVLELADRLRADGVDANLDQYEPSPAAGWARWAEDQIAESDFVLVVCSATYAERFQGNESAGKGLGARWEGAIVRQQLYQAGARNPRFLPVVFSEDDEEHIPTILGSFTSYNLGTPAGYENLYRRVTGQPDIERPRLGRLKQLPNRSASPKTVAAETLQPEGAGAVLAANRLAPLISAPVLDPVGRVREIEKVFQTLERMDSIAITGIAGVGKSTVLALAIRRIYREAPDLYTDFCYHKIIERGSPEERLGRMLIDLVGGLDPAADIGFDDLEAGFIQARRLLAGRRALLAIDSADERESQEMVQRLGSRLPKLTIAVTSQIVGWQEVPTLSLEGLPDSDGARLFARRSNVDGEEKHLVQEICRRVGGHPMMINRLALEARDQKLSPRQLLASLTEDYDLDRDLARRFDASFSRQSDGAKRALTVIGILDATSLRVDLLSQVAQASAADLRCMADQHLLHFHLDLSRCTVHDLFRAWSRNRLRGGDEETAALRNRIAGFYQEFLRARRAGKPEDLTDIDQEWQSLLRLIDTLQDPKLSLSLVDEAIGDYLDDPHGYVARRRQTASLLSRSSLVLAHARQVGGSLAARVEKNLGLFAYWTGEHARAERLFHRAGDRYRAQQDTVGQAATTWLLGYLADDENRYPEALDLYQEGLTLAERNLPSDRVLAERRQPSRQVIQALGHHLIGCTLYHQGKFEEAEGRFRTARDMLSLRTEPDLLSRIERRLGFVALKRERFEEAQKTFERVAAEVARLERPRDAARIARHLGELYLRLDRLDAAEKALAKALRDFEHLGGQRGIGSTLRCLATLERRRGSLDEAERLCRQSLEIAERTRSFYGMAAGHEELADILESRQAPRAKVRRNRQRACNIYTVIGHQRAISLATRLDQEQDMAPRLPHDVRGVLFDLMDTLAYLDSEIYDHTKQEFADRCGVSLEHFKAAWSDSRHRASTGIFETTEARLRWVAGTVEAALSDAQFRKMAEEEEAMWARSVRLYEGSIPLLRSLREQGLRTAVLSNGPVAMNALVDVLGLEPYVDAFLLSSKIGVKKPDGDAYHKALERIGLSPAQGVYVGDGNDRELDGAREVGLFTIKIKRPRPPYANLKNESLDWDLAVESIAELQTLLHLGPRSAAP